MNPLQRENYRRAILLVLDANASPYGVGLPALRLLVQHYGFYPTDVETLAELTYLADKGFIIEVQKQLSPENRQYRITATGRDFLASTTPVPPA